VLAVNAHPASPAGPDPAQSGQDRPPVHLSATGGGCRSWPRPGIPWVMATIALTEA